MHWKPGFWPPPTMWGFNELIKAADKGPVEFLFKTKIAHYPDPKVHRIVGKRSNQGRAVTCHHLSAGQNLPVFFWRDLKWTCGCVSSEPLPAIRLWNVLLKVRGKTGTTAYGRWHDHAVGRVLLLNKQQFSIHCSVKIMKAEVNIFLSWNVVANHHIAL